MAKANSEQVKEYIKIATYLGIGYLGYKALKSIAETFGISKTESQQTIDTGTTAAAGSTIEAQSNNPYLSFSPQYRTALMLAYKKKYPNKIFNVGQQYKFSTSEYLDMAQRIYDAKGFFKDNENSVFDIFRNLQTQYQVSLLANSLSILKKKDLLEYLKTFMDDENLREVLDIIKNYPQYYS
jgi:hypothetical protein